MSALDLFSFHLLRVPLTTVPGFLYSGLRPPGLHHAESFFTMQLGEAVLSARRYGFSDVATFACWRDEAALDEFLTQPAGRRHRDGWHVRLRLYRRWGHISEIDEATVDSDAARPDQPVVAVTLARLRLSQTLRFTQFGKPVERQVRDHPGKTLALAAMRPPTTFCTFSVWRDEAAMTGMVYGRDEAKDGGSHNLAMRERARKDFHREFATMRMVPLREVGEYNGRSGYTQAG